MKITAFGGVMRRLDEVCCVLRRLCGVRKKYAAFCDDYAAFGRSMLRLGKLCGDCFVVWNLCDAIPQRSIELNGKNRLLEAVFFTACG
ncbi:hypothetical protein [Sporosarcina saromensis]|uniref:hypothetical protein n=1 Tax=Sporosarcina saromensis TaxID=359365 RepID=UPI00295F15C1|nr:hypothetical protein [Sporosarcina saromensis]